MADVSQAQSRSVKKAISFDHLLSPGKNPFVETESEACSCSSEDEMHKKGKEKSSPGSKLRKKSFLDIIGGVGGDSPFSENYEASTDILYEPDEEGEIDWTSQFNKMKAVVLVVCFILTMSLYVFVDLHLTKTRMKNLEVRMSFMESGANPRQHKMDSFDIDIQAVIDGIKEDVKELGVKLVSRFRSLLQDDIPTEENQTLTVSAAIAIEGNEEKETMLILTEVDAEEGDEIDLSLETVGEHGEEIEDDKQSDIKEEEKVGSNETLSLNETSETNANVDTETTSAPSPSAWFGTKVIPWDEEGANNLTSNPKNDTDGQLEGENKTETGSELVLYDHTDWWQEIMESFFKYFNVFYWVD